MDRVNIAHWYVRSEGNILRRALSAAEYADILHFEVCWLDGFEGDRVTPNLHLLGRGNVYLTITTTNVHFVAMRGADPTVATLPLSEIDEVEAKGPVPARFFHSFFHGEPEAMHAAKRFEIRARRGLPWPNGATALGPADAVRQTTDATSTAQTARPTESVTYAQTAPGSVGPVTESDAGTPRSTIGAWIFSRRRDVVTRAENLRRVPSHPTRVASPPAVQSEAFADTAWTREADSPDVAVESARTVAFDVRSAVAEANARAFDRIQGVMMRAAEESQKNEKETELRDAVRVNKKDASVAEREEDVFFQTERVRFVSIERGSQALYQLERAVLVAHARKAQEDALARDALHGNVHARASEDDRVVAAEAAATLAARLPVECLSCLDDFSVVVAAADDAEGGIAAGPIVFAADMARLMERATRSADGEIFIPLANTSGGDDGSVDEDTHFVPLPGVGDVATATGTESESESETETKPPPGSALVGPLQSSSGSLLKLDPVSSRAAHEEFLLRVSRGTCVSAPVKPALVVAVATLEAARVRRDIETARAAASGDPDDFGAARSTRSVFDRERELFAVLERAMLAPRRGGAKGGVGEMAGIRIERVGAFETDDLCAASAMAEHAKRSRALRGLALGAPQLFETVARRLARAVLEATHPHPALRRRRQGRDDALGFGGVANWARLALAARQGAAAHRALHLFHWIRSVVSRSEGSAFERLDLATRESGVFRSVVQSAFAFCPAIHPAARGGEKADLRQTRSEARDSLASDSGFTRLRHPSDGCAEGILDAVVDTLHACVSVAAHANLLSGGHGWNAHTHAVAHHMVCSVPPRDVRPKVAAMFARMVNASFDAFAEDERAGPRGAAAVRAFRCADLLRHLIEGAPDSMVTKCIRDEYDVELKHVFTRKDVYERTTKPGDSFYEKHARSRFDWVMREVCPEFGKAQKEASKAEALALWREEMLVQGQKERIDVEAFAEVRARRPKHEATLPRGERREGLPPGEVPTSPTSPSPRRPETNENAAPVRGVGDANGARTGKVHEDVLIRGEGAVGPRGGFRGD